MLVSLESRGDEICCHVKKIVLGFLLKIGENERKLEESETTIELMTIS